VGSFTSQAEDRISRLEDNIDELENSNNIKEKIMNRTSKTSETLLKDQT
jgi:hypothetical protein